MASVTVNTAKNTTGKTDAAIVAIGLVTRFARAETSTIRKMSVKPDRHLHAAPIES